EVNLNKSKDIKNVFRCSEPKMNPEHAEGSLRHGGRCNFNSPPTPLFQRGEKFKDSLRHVECIVQLIPSPLLKKRGRKN
ncbi:MAG: hypothetical protein M3Q56_05460, partial [Bacteroidota bacterium]|nr:hypothetical protein [Bacteroidota bacterium]